MSRPATQKRLSRIVRGAPRVIDLFSGCGGLSLGFDRAGCEIIAAAENDPDAAHSHFLNFGHSETGAGPSPAIDITKTRPGEFLEKAACDFTDADVDILIGGPPCQAFARVGRAKLREIAEHPEAFRNDPRAVLYRRYLEYVEHFRPLVILMENVPDVMNFGGHNIPEEICESLEDMGYSCSYTLLNSAFYGVPQTRERMYLVAVLEELDADFRFPEPTHWTKLPPGYTGTRSTALKSLAKGIHSHFVEPPEADKGLKSAVKAKEAIGDLPAVYEHLEGKLRRGARRFDQKLDYSGREPSEYARLMREWPGFESAGFIADHVFRYLPRDYRIFRVMEPGDEYPQAHEAAMRLFRKALSRAATARGARPRKGSKAYEELLRKYVPPYDPGKFPNKWRKMEAGKPARTLLAHLGKDSYSHIHYDSAQARTITVREAARLQSFPDGFVFSGTMNPAFRQIGNAVPPLMAFVLAEAIVGSLQSCRLARHHTARSASQNLERHRMAV